MLKILVTFCFLFVSNLATANIILNGTRFIYPGNDKTIFVKLTNTGSLESLVQSWIDEGDIQSTPETTKAPFFLTPPVIKVDGNGAQQISISYRGSGNLPQDRESVYYLNVLDIPPTAPGMESKSTLQFAIRTRVKLFYRPANITENPDKAAEKISLQRKGNNLLIKNGSPFYISISKLGLNKTSKLNKEGFMVAPFSEYEEVLNKGNAVASGSSIVITYINDLGGYDDLSKTVN